MPSFASYALSKKMIDALKSQGYVSPTPIQDAVIPAALRGESLVARSPTGSGKTHSFLIPIIEKIDLESREIQAVIVAPTRELAKQTYDFARKFNVSYPALRILLLSAGEERTRTIEKLARVPHLIIATPGRLHDLAVKEKVINFLTAKTFVLDEADMLMEMGFFNDINVIISNLTKPQMLVFSATIPEKLASALEKYVEAKHVIEVSGKELTAGKVRHYFIDTRHRDLKECVKEFIHIKNPYLLLIFASKKETVESIYEYLRSQSIKAAMIHGDLEVRERKSVMKRIHANEFNVIVASDMASRGIDIEDVSDILNVDLPKNLEFYYHRAGRTGRNGKDGQCFTFYDNDQTTGVQKILDMGTKGSFLIFKDGDLVEGKPIVPAAPKFRKKKNPELEKEIKKAAGMASSKVVKPGYKRKVRVAVERAKARHRRKVIKRDIRRQQVERYKMQAKEPKK